jgi:hypothetical protein
MGRMIFDLTDDDREALERIRVELGARSHAEALRLLIRRGVTSGVTPRPNLTQRPAKPPAKAVEAANRAIREAQANPPSVAVPFAGNLERKPMQKGSKK